MIVQNPATTMLIIDKRTPEDKNLKQRNQNRFVKRLYRAVMAIAALRPAARLGMIRKTGRGVWITACDDSKCKRIKDRGIHGGVAGRSDPVFRHARKPIIEMQLDLVMVWRAAKQT